MVNAPGGESFSSGKLRQRNNGAWLDNTISFFAPSSTHGAGALPITGTGPVDPATGSIASHKT